MNWKTLFVSMMLIVATASAYASPDSLIVEGGDLRINGGGNGLVFPDGSIQYQATLQGPQGEKGDTGSQGAPGSQGASGSDGLTSLISMLDEPLGASCTYGGVQIQAGIDSNRSGTLDAGEVTQVKYVCNGISSYSANDLTGTWNFIQFASGSTVTAGTHWGWQRGVMSLDANGDSTVASMENNLNPSPTLPAVGSTKFVLYADGVVGITGPSAPPLSRSILSADKQLIVSSANYSDGSRALRFYVKKTSGFGDADISLKTFGYNQLSSGANNLWNYGTGVTDASRQVTIATSFDPFGAASLPPANFKTLSITSDGIVTASNNPSSKGVLTPDKTMLFTTETQGGSHVLRITRFDAGSFATADMAGTWRSNNLISSPTSPKWEQGTFSISSAGLLTMISSFDSDGETETGGGATISVSPTGEFTVADSTVHGFVSSNKSMAVITETWDPGEYSLGFILKK